MVTKEEYDKHYPSGEPGTHGREPFEDEDTQSNRLDTGRAAAAGSGDILSGGKTSSGAGGVGGGVGGLASDSHGGTLSRDTEVRGGEVVGLGGPKESAPSAVGGASHVPSGPGASAGAGAGAGAGAFAASSAAAGGHSHGHGNTGPTGTNTGTRDTLDKTGTLSQEAHKYESTGSRGPTSSGAPNTDKFDTGSTNYGQAGVGPPPTVEQDDSHRKGTGGVGGILGTTDREFTANPSRTGEGAYHDSHGLFKTNTSGPSGQTALTGREGTAENNPVAQAQSRSQGGETAGTEGEKKGVMDKIKDAFK